MAKDKMHKFFDNQTMIIDNLRSIKSNLEEIEEISFFDPDESLYNEILALIDQAKGSDTSSDLAEVIQKAKVMEVKLDSWFAKEGIETLELSWPEL
ncbi:MAG: hypothetical protein K1060chlam3_00953 [Candidatus Anoxychlamydiales bacterium]|nr:hypothetical protein [Candidatus Anoxychlamydiales bacterium]